MKLLFAGDFCTRSKRSVIAVDTLQFDSIVKEIRPIVKRADFSIVNMETPIVNDDNQCPVYPEFVQLGSDKRVIECLKYTGFDLLACANNHVHDYGDKGVYDTINALHQSGVSYVGIGKNCAAASQVFYKTINDKRVAVINFCENEFSVATPSSPGACGMDIVTNYYQIREARDNSDLVVVFIHGGVEHYSYPTPNMKKRYHFYVDLGADIVVNSHQHCYSGYEYYKGKPIIYGLGNLFFDLDNPIISKWNYGCLAEVDVEDHFKIKLFPYKQGTEDMSIHLLDSYQYEAFSNSINEINANIMDDNKLCAVFNDYLDKEQLKVLYTFLPYNKVYLSLLIRKIVPLILSRKKRVLILNYLRCESRRETLVGVFCKLLNIPNNYSI